MICCAVLGKLLKLFIETYSRNQGRLKGGTCIIATCDEWLKGVTQGRQRDKGKTWLVAFNYMAVKINLN